MVSCNILCKFALSFSVFNVTLPPADEKANYVHRIGRVGRADRLAKLVFYKTLYV
jgi:hypothetical protein